MATVATAPASAPAILVTTPAYAFDLGREPMIVLPAAVKLWEKWFGLRPHLNQLRRLYSRPNRHGLILPTMLVGGRRMTSEAALRWYFEATSAASRRPFVPPNGATVAMTPSERDTLVRAGVLDSREV